MRMSLPTTLPALRHRDPCPTGPAPTTSGGHYAVDRPSCSVRRRVPTFGAMRRRRNELEYPTGPGETTTYDEARKAIRDAEGLLLRSTAVAHPFDLLTAKSENQQQKGQLITGVCGPRMPTDRWRRSLVGAGRPVTDNRNRESRISNCCNAFRVWSG
jgi:hypothetical protein